MEEKQIPKHVFVGKISLFIFFIKLHYGLIQSLEGIISQRFLLAARLGDDF